MGGDRIDLNLSLPCDPRLVDALRQLAVLAAATCGCEPSRSDAFGREVERAVRECLARRGPGERIAVTVRHQDGPVEVVVDNHPVVLPV
jgi:hypothetical protein